ncbi:MAG: hypothetical protein AB9919_11180 [Geobacteraceae bacterium]
MWIFTSYGFLSIVAHKEHQEMLLVRARFFGHIQHLFPGAEVNRTDDADYLYRAIIPRKEVSEVISRMVANIDYPNFKDTVIGPDYHNACIKTWETLNYAQAQADPAKEVLKKLNKPLSEIRKEYEKFLPISITLAGSWPYRLRCWEAFLILGPLTAKLLRSLRNSSIKSDGYSDGSEHYNEECRSMYPELHDFVMEVFPEEVFPDEE